MKTEVLAAVSRGNAQKADKFIALHGYYRLVNMFRLEYARLYKLRYPDAIQDAVAAESGFTSRVIFTRQESLCQTFMKRFPLVWKSCFSNVLPLKAT